MNKEELFFIKEALHLLAEKAHLDNYCDSDFDTIAQLEKDFTNTYYLEIGA